MKAIPRRFFRWFTSWDTGTCIFALSFFLTLITFDILWCMWTTFTPFSHPPLYVSAILITLLLTLPYALFRCRTIEFLLLLLLDLFLVANLMYARTYFNAIPLTSYTNAGNLADFMPSVYSSIRWTDIIFILITLVTIWFTIKYKKQLAKSPKTNIIAYLTALAIPVIITFIVFPTPAHFKDTYRRYSDSAYAYRSMPVMYSLFGNLIYDTLVAYERLTPAEEAETMEYISNRPRIPAIATDSITTPQNLVFILCESLEGWVIDAKYNGQEITPNLNAILKDSGTYYNPHVLSQAKDGRSIDGQLLYLTGLMPLEQGTYATQYPDNYFPSIHKALKKAHGSRAILMSGDKEYVWNQGQVARNMGMDTIISFKDFRLEDNFTGRKHIGDRALMRQCVEKLSEDGVWPIGQPVFLQMVTYSGHGPFRLPKSEKKLKIAPGTPQIMADYMQTAHYTDEALGIMIRYLKSRPDWNNTMVIITGDHEGLASWRGECLASDIGKQLVSSEQYVPLMILNSPIPGRSNKIIGQVDVFSTMLHLLGLHDYDWPGLGQSALDPAHPGCAISPQGKIVGSNIRGGKKAIEQRLRQNQRMSDRIIRFDLLNPHQ